MMDGEVDLGDLKLQLQAVACREGITVAYVQSSTIGLSFV